ncbi:MAG: T9SS type A sorting domain-containing protein, partial [Ignavibacteriota bacterium]
SADTTGANFSEIYICGDSVLSKFLRVGNLIEITSIHPNPAQDGLEIELQSAMKQDANIEIYDALGARVLSESRNIIQGSNSIHLDTHGLSGGVYLLRLGSVSQSFIKVK